MSYSIPRPRRYKRYHQDRCKQCFAVFYRLLELVEDWLHPGRRHYFFKSLQSRTQNIFSCGVLLTIIPRNVYGPSTPSSKTYLKHISFINMSSYLYRGKFQNIFLVCKYTIKNKHRNQREKNISNAGLHINTPVLCVRIYLLNVDGLLG